MACYAPVSFQIDSFECSFKLKEMLEILQHFVIAGVSWRLHCNPGVSSGMQLCTLLSITISVLTSLTVIINFSLVFWSLEFSFVEAQLNS